MDSEKKRTLEATEKDDVSTKKLKNNDSKQQDINDSSNNNIKETKDNGQTESESVESKITPANGNGSAEKPMNGASGDKQAKVNEEESKEKEEPKVESEKKETDEKDSKNDDEKTESASEKKSSEKLEEKEIEEEEDDGCGTLLLCGGANWDMTGRKELPRGVSKPTGPDAPAARNLLAPNRVISKETGQPLRVKGVFSGCNACHSVIITESGSVYTFGRNDKGQLGTGDTDTRILPTHIPEFDGLDIVAAACGRSHTLFMGSDGVVYSCGDNKMGQCGTNQRSVQQILTPTRTTFSKKAAKLACGAEFSIILDTQGDLYSFGHPEYGQLGHNSEEKYFTSGNKYAYNCEYSPRKISTYVTKTNDRNMVIIDNVVIVDVACGTNHSLAVDSKGRCYSWGFGGYHRLGHCETANVHVPRSIKVFEAPESSSRGAVSVHAGSSHSMAVDVNGVLYFWGQNKSSGEATMYPKVVQDLCGWKIQAVTCANRSIFVVAEGCCISWGPSPTYGELGYGEGRAKSSTTPEQLRSIEGVQVFKIACGFGHTLMIAKDSKSEDKTALDKLPQWP